MAIDRYNHFVAIVAGDNPEVLMSPYDKNLKTDPTVVYKYADAEKLREEDIEAYESIADSPDIDNGPFKDDAQDKLEIIRSQTAHDFFLDLTCEYDHDDETGDAITTENLNGKWSSYRTGKLFSVPFILKDGREAFQAKKCDVDWELMHLYGGEIYDRAWEW